MKLETKHLAAYLPYGLNCEVKDFGKKTVAKMSSVYLDGTCTFDGVIESEKGFKSVKPILKSIVGFEEIVRLEFEKYDDNEVCDKEIIDLFCYEKWGSDTIEELDLLQFPYDSVLYLLKNHYDIFGLIENGLAIKK